MTLEFDPSAGQQQDYDTDTMTDILKRVTRQNDNARITSATMLINSFNHAVQVQSGRRIWIASDFRAFAIALAAMDSIGIVEQQSNAHGVTSGNGIADAIEQDIANSVADDYGGTQHGLRQR